MDTYKGNTSYTDTTYALTYPMTIGHDDNATYKNASPYSSGVFEWPMQLPEGYTAYYAKGNTETTDGTLYLTITKLELDDSRILPANTPVILAAKSGSEGNEVTMHLYSSSSITNPDENVLRGDAVEHTTTPSSWEGRDSIFYGMTYDTDGEAVLRKANVNVVVPAGKVYIVANSVQEEGSNSPVKEMITIGEGDATGIKAIADGEGDGTTKPTVVYDLQGRRVARPAHGLYIINGKKIYVK